MVQGESFDEALSALGAWVIPRSVLTLNGFGPREWKESVWVLKLR